ncbi:MAG TPA: NADH:ubiquinone reductase (Na(+)-transporting) subunit F [Myxococcota bacterium]|nr:NADH:ubiquinone reductase (Na(+)-transporting) subunit F [Myxococcota bacterium]
MIEILLGAGLFTGVVMLLVGLVLAARAWLLPRGEAAVQVNGERQVAAPRGEKLLGALIAASIPIPAGCGGKGTCGQCRVTVTAGGGPVLPTEASRLSRREIASGVRLACQLTVRDDLAITVPEDILGVQRWTCRVRSTRCVATFIKEIVFELPEGESVPPPAGRFVLVTCPPYRRSYRDLNVDPSVRDEWDRLDLWRHEASTDVPTTRAYSLANHPGEKGILMLIVRIATPPPAVPDAPPGIVSSWLFDLRPGDTAEVAGPYGHFKVEEGDSELIFVGGGAGMAPMRAHILDQLVRQGTQRRISFWYGARSLRELFYADIFDRLAAEHPNFRWTVALSEPRSEDAWQGERGFIHEVLQRRYLAEHPAPETCDYYLCGPPMMVRAMRAMLDDLGVDPERIKADDFGG